MLTRTAKGQGTPHPSESMNRHLMFLQAVSLMSAGLLITACGASPWDERANAQTTATQASQTQTGATASPKPMTRAVEPTSAPTAVATTKEKEVGEALGTSPSLPTPDSSKFPKDTAGRVLGGNQPIINYAPDMVTGKPCPRITKWVSTHGHSGHSA